MYEHFLKVLISSLIAKNAREFNVDARYVGAIIYQESVRGSKALSEAVVAYRFEEEFFKTYIEGKALTGYVPNVGLHLDSEKYSRAASYGLMQIMGATAREHGLETKYVTALFLPWINIRLGTKYFAKLVAQFDGNYYMALRRYNGAISNPITKTYADSVIDHVTQKRYKAVML